MCRLVCIVAFAMLAVVCGCSQGATTFHGTETVAIAEAKAAVAEWGRLLNEGSGEDFLRAALPESVLSNPEVVGADGRFRPDFLEKFYRLLPQIHQALQEAKQLEPVVRGGNVVFEFPEAMQADELFQDRRMYLSKTDGKWHFNGPNLKKQR